MNLTEANLNGQKRIDSHVHDRMFTAQDKYVNHQASLLDLMMAPLPMKQRAVGILHELEKGVLGPAYTAECLEMRMETLIGEKIVAGEGEVHIVCDTTADALQTLSLDTALRLKKKHKDTITIRAYCYPIFGLNPAYPERLEVLERAAERADGIVGLAERDLGNSLEAYGHTREILRIAKKRHLVAQFHVGQENSPFQHDVEEMIQAVKWLGSPEVKWVPEGEPTVWAVHNISMACYSEQDFWQNVDDLLKYNIGVIACGHAATSNRARRHELTPTHNSITRVLELAYAGVHIRLGTDNVNDIFMVTPNKLPYCALLDREIDLLSSVLRYQIPSFWEKLACGVKLNEVDRKLLGEAIEDNYKFWGFNTEVLKKYLH